MQNQSVFIELLETLEVWTNALDSGYDVDVVYMDCSKAFDSVLSIFKYWPYRTNVASYLPTEIRSKVVRFKITTT